MLPGTTKILTMYEVKGRILGFIIVAAVVVFIIILSGYNRGAEPDLEKPLSWAALNYGKSYNDVHRKDTIINKTNDIYAVVFDAGSTGSRVHVLHFKSEEKGHSLVLVKEMFDYVKPGLSSFGHDPVKGAESLRKMLNLALSVVPSELQAETPITLKATAGLRLLPEKNSSAILQKVRSLFREYNFLVPDDAVMVMDGEDEGVFSWMTVNFLLGRLQKDRDSVAALDLGGGSTQVTFKLQEQATISGSPKDCIKTVQLFKNQYVLYTHSYLGLGLKAVRYSILGGSHAAKKTSTTLSSVCLPSDYIGTWKYNGAVYNISGVATLKADFSLCWGKAQELVTNNVYKVDELKKKELYLFSYFYDRAVDGNILTKGDKICTWDSFPVYIHRLNSVCWSGDKGKEEGGKLTVGDFEKAARKEFKNPHPQKPFLAMDLTYIYALLHDGYRLAPGDHVMLKKKINDVEVSWAVGAAFQLLSSTGKAR